MKRLLLGGIVALVTLSPPSQSKADEITRTGPVIKNKYDRMTWSYLQRINGYLYHNVTQPLLRDCEIEIRVGSALLGASIVIRPAR